jgi:hypothetical protein
MMSAAHDGGTAEILEGQFPILAPGGALGQVDYVAAIDLPGESRDYGTLLPRRPGSRLLYFAQPASIKSPPATRYNNSFDTGPLPPQSSRAETKNAIEPKNMPRIAEHFHHKDPARLRCIDFSMTHVSALILAHAFLGCKYRGARAGPPLVARESHRTGWTRLVGRVWCGDRRAVLGVDKRCMKRLPFAAPSNPQTHTPWGFACLRRATSAPYAHLWITLWIAQPDGRKVPYSIPLRPSQQKRAEAHDGRHGAIKWLPTTPSQAAKRVATGLARERRFFYPHDRRFCCGYVHK